MRHIITTQYTSEEFKSLIDTAVNEALQQLIPLILKSTNSPPSADPLLTRGDVCKRLRVSTPTLSKLMKQGEVKSCVVGGSYRFSEKHIMEFLNKK